MIQFNVKPRKANYLVEFSIDLCQIKKVEDNAITYRVMTTKKSRLSTTYLAMPKSIFEEKPKKGQFFIRQTFSGCGYHTVTVKLLNENDQKVMNDYFKPIEDKEFSELLDKLKLTMTEFHVKSI